MTGCETLFAAAARRLLPAEARHSRAFRGRLPPALCAVVEALALQFNNMLVTVADLVTPAELIRCLRISRGSRTVEVINTIKSLEPIVNLLDFFEICARFCIDETTERLYDLMSSGERSALLKRHSLVQCRVNELRNADVVLRLRRFRYRNNLPEPGDDNSADWAEDRRVTLENGSTLADVYYERIALDCAKSGFYEAFERCLGKIESLSDVVLPQCVLEAIRHGQYHIANRVAGCENYDKAFYLVFPDGRVPAAFFSALLDADLVKEGERIAVALLNYLPRFDVQRLRWSMENDQRIAHSGLLRKFDTIYSEVLDQRDYPYDDA